MLGPGDIEGTFEAADCPLCGAADREVVIPEARDRLLGHPGVFRICQCRGCGARYLDPRPVGETLVGYYRPRGGKSYPDNEERRVKKLKPAIPWLLHVERGYPPPAGPRPSARELERARRRFGRDRDRWRFLPWRGKGRLLDVGCGSGAYMAMMRNLGWKPEGTNVVPEAAAAVRQRFGIPCHAGDLSSQEIPPGSFDAVTLWHVLEHMPDPRSALARARALLVPGGLLGVGVPVYDCAEAEILGDVWLGYEVPRHLVTFSRARLRSFLEECGFQIISLHSEMRDRVLKISYARAEAPWHLKFLMRHGRLRRWYARRLTSSDRIGTVVALAQRPGA
jgi:SAM-dependent methyltransferase